MIRACRDVYQQFFRYWHTLKNMGLIGLWNRVTFLYRRKFVKFLDTNRVSAMAKGLRDGLIGKGISVEEIEILDWIAEHKEERSLAWEPYELSKRLTKWVKLAQAQKVSQEVASVMKDSINLQLKRLFVDLEVHSPASHLLENCRGYLFGCSYIIHSREYFNNESEYQLESIVHESIRQVKRQFLKDGAHFERTPMVHKESCEILEDIRDIAKFYVKQNFLLPEILDAFNRLIKLCNSKLVVAYKWLEKMTMSDGKLAQFNDTEQVEGLPHSFDELSELCLESGYFFKHNHDYSFILSCGIPSPKFQPGHSHCDTLSYELAVNGKRIIVDTGLGSFENPAIRQITRETQSHNLPMVQHQEQSDLWGNFSMGKRLRVLNRDWNQEKALLSVGIIDQYEQRISRGVEFKDNRISFNDSLENRKMTGNFISLIHLAPWTEIKVTESQFGDKEIHCILGKQSLCIQTNDNVRIDDYLQFPTIGKANSAKVIILSNKESSKISYSILFS